MLGKVKNLSLFLLLTSLVYSTMIQSDVNSKRVFVETNVGQNLLRLDSQSLLNSCESFNGAICTSCKAGFILTNGKCYQVIPNCLIQYSNICATCQTNYRPTTSLSTTQKSSIQSYVIICIPDTLIPTLNSTSSLNTSLSLSSTSSINPLIFLGRQTFINWKLVEVRYPTDVYLVMIWNFLDGNDELINKIKIQDNNLTSCIQGRVKDGTDKLSVIKWVIDNQLTNFVQGNLVDLSNLYFYRLRYKSRLTQIDYQILVMIHEINFKITLLQQIQVTNNNSQNNINVSIPIVGSNMTESDQVKSLRQQVLDLKLKVSQQRQLNNERQVKMLLFQQYTILSSQSIQSDPNCIVIKSYLENSFSDFIKLLQLDYDSPSIGFYSWMNFNIKRVYFRKSDSIDKQYLYEISFTNDITVLAQFIINRTYQINSISIIFNR